MKLEFTDERHENALAIEKGAIGNILNKPDYPVSYWLSLACSLLTSRYAREREVGKMMVRYFRTQTPLLVNNVE